MRAVKICLAASLLIALPLVRSEAQNGSSINGPSLGFVSNDAGTKIWPLVGILGASIPGQPLELQESITRAAISPRQDYALAISASSGQPLLIHLDNAATVPLAARANPTLIALSPTGAGAALYDRESRVLQFLSGLPAAPQIAYELDTSGMQGDVQRIAVSDDAGIALVLAGNESQALWAIRGNGSMTAVSAVRPSQVAFVANKPDALVADDATQEVFLLQSLDQSPVRMPGIVLREGARQFAAIAASTDGRSLYVAQEGSENIAIIDLQTREGTAVSCHCKPIVIAPLKGDSLFRLNNLSHGPISVLDASTSTPRALFIPVDPNVVAEHREQ